MEPTKKYFNGNLLSEREIKANRVSYKTLSRCFGYLICETLSIIEVSFFNKLISGNLYYYKDENGNEISEEEAKEKKEKGENVDTFIYDNFQFYIVDDNAIEYLKEAGEIVYYSKLINGYIWCSKYSEGDWPYVNTSIKIDPNRD